jgi:capsular polysaccharide biosynthesis protein/Mrp family chromosome partitioning ATPase
VNNSEKSQTKIIQVVRHWLWLLLLAPLLAGAISYYLTKDEPILYEAEAQLMIGPGLDTPNPDLNSLRTSGFLAQTYKKLAATDTFLQTVDADLKVNVPIKDLREMIVLQTDPNSLILTIDVQSEDPGLAINIANAVASELLNISPANPNNPASIMQEQNRAQVNALEETIKQTESKIASLESDMQKLDAQVYTVNTPQYQTLDATENWVKYLESEYQKLTSVAAQSQMGNQILNELTKNSVSRLNGLETDLHNTDQDLQHLVLAQIDAENSYLSSLQETLLELQQYVEGKPLDEYIQSIQSNIADLNEKYANISFYDTTNLRFFSDQITAERQRLTAAEKIADDRRMQIFFRLSDERGRLSAMKALPVTESLEKRQIISDQIKTESDHLTTLQNSRAALSSALLQSWTNQVQITQLASTTSKVPSNFQLIVLSACIAGLAAAMAFVIAVEYFDESVQYVRELETTFGIPLLGRLQTTRFRSILPPSDAYQTVIKTLPHSVTAEDYRLLAVKMLLRLEALNSADSENDASKKSKRPLGKGSPVSDGALPHTILICSLNSEDNISEIAANIAVVLAQTGNTVLLVDSKLRGPVNAQPFGADKLIGSSITLALADSPVELLTVPEEENLYILPINPSLSDPFGLFTATQAPEVIGSLKKYATYILIVGSDLMTSTETFGLASRVDGVILTIPEMGLKPDQVNSLMKNAATYKWEIIGTVLVKIRTSLEPVRKQLRGFFFERLGKSISTAFITTRTFLQHFLSQLRTSLLDRLGKSLGTAIYKIRAGLQHLVNQSRPFLLGKLRKIPEKEETVKESNDIEGQSL